MTIARSYADLLVIARARRLALGVPLLELDDRIGWQSGYAGKIEAWQRDENGKRKPNTRALSMVSLFDLLGALGLRLEIVIADTAPPPGADIDHRRRAVLEPHLAAWHRRRLTPFTSETGAAAARKRLDKLGKRGRRELARKAALARAAKRRASTAPPCTT